MSDVTRPDDGFFDRYPALADLAAWAARWDWRG